MFAMMHRPETHGTRFWFTGSHPGARQGDVRTG